MNKRSALVVGCILIVVCVLGIILHVQNIKNSLRPVNDYKNGTYLIAGENVTLVNGHSETALMPGSASKIITQYFGNDAQGDINSDGVPDVAFVVRENSGGSGTYFYIVAALHTPEGYRGTNGILLGDRIAPQTIEIKNGEIIVNYSDRTAAESMTTKPSLAQTKHLKITGVTLQEIPQP